MAYFLECKQCGGQVTFQEGELVSLCPYCGSQNTIGKAAAEQGGLVNRANYLRRNNEFDKAAAVYEELLKSDNTDYEAHWGLVLCKFGIEYVDDPASGERKPTCHRTYPDSVFADAAYRTALEYAHHVELGKDIFVLLQLAEQVVRYGNAWVITDGVIATMNARAAMRSAFYSVRINLKSIKDETFVTKMINEIREIEEKAAIVEQNVEYEYRKR